MLDLTGDRDIEWSFVAARIPEAPGDPLQAIRGTALDFGCRDTSIGLIAAMKGYQTLSIDLEPHVFTWWHPNRRFLQIDLLHPNFDGCLDNKQFDLVINCSTIEHVGLAGRYGVVSGELLGDIRAMDKLYNLMKPAGKQILTLPVGKDAVFPPLHRVYGEKRFFQLIGDLLIERAEFWIKDPQLGWNLATWEDAFNYKAEWSDQRRIYAIGCFTLMKRPT